MDRDKLAKQIMAECEKDGEPVTLDEALEMADMEIKSKKNCKQYVSDKTKKREIKPREKKIDEEKVEIIQTIAQNLDRTEFETTNIQIKNIQREITFTVGENNYSVTLTKHRKPKQK